jgi:hypothetical protein
MKVLVEEIKYCLGKAKEITEQYQLYHIAADDPQRSVDNLLKTCEEFLKTKINRKELEIQKDDSSVLGAYFNVKNVDEECFEICYVQGLNYCWKRYVTCKELFHVILDKEEYRNMDIGSHIEQVTTAFPDSEAEPDNSVAVELFAEISAMEFLFPYKSRVEELKGPLNGNFYAIADKYKAPQVLVEKYLSNAWMDFLAPFHQ